MGARLAKSLPIVAVIGALTAVLCLGVQSAARHSTLVDTGETRRAVETGVLTSLLALHPSSIDDPAFRAMLAKVQNMPYVAYVWLFTPDGEIIQGNLAVSKGDTAEEMATDETRRVLGILPEQMLSAEQRMAVLSASAMQREGEHNDVFRHLLRELRGPNGELVAMVGLTYDVSPGIGKPPNALTVLLLVGLLLGMGVYWLSLPLWVWLDARTRGERAWVWAVFVLLGNLVALIAYILARVPRQQGAVADREEN
jgi:hypothetical protein